jgi:Antibiotic biosynthesis monooxygenase
LGLLFHCLSTDVPSCQRSSRKNETRHSTISQTSDKSSIVTLINTFTVAPGNQQRLVDLLIRATDGFVSGAPGFISSTFRRRIDGRKVAMYAQR